MRKGVFGVVGESQQGNIRAQKWLGVNKTVEVMIMEKRAKA